jgi:uncharacterized protein YjcR
MEVFEMKNVKHQERTNAVKWFLAGVPKEQICDKLNITKNIFRVWVGGYEDFKEFRKKVAFMMFVAGVDELEICRQLGIGGKKLHSWVKEGYELKTDIPKLLWIDDICKTFMKLVISVFLCLKGAIENEEM